MKTEKRLMKVFLMLLFLVLVSENLFAQAPGGGGGNQLQSLKSAIQMVLGIMFLIAFPWGVVTIWQGAVLKKKGDPEAYNSIIAGLWIAGGALIIGAIFYAFSLGGAVLTPQF
ncbi:MAG TPA: hypothetical protein DCZ94_06005 [Lentisphaeria bacterium]|nr:MAG: hypothetical protein A2X48_07515 [Lentisphaerae bacterium GWF2_49_21]HBC86490.1 hypothetical protein [Lentisphaeria bacterium]